MDQSDKIPSRGNRKVWISFILAIFLLGGAEAALQFRAYMKGDEDAPVETVDDGGIYYFNDEYQLKLIQPNIDVDEGYRVVRSNSLGLRSPEISAKKQDNEIRIAMLGASSVMGMLNPVNEETIPYRLQADLQAQFPDKKISVINGGIAGYYFADQQQLFEKVLEPLDLDLVVFYSGFNNVSLYCDDGGVPQENHGLMNIPLPSWVLSIELLVKNTAILRALRPEVEQTTDPKSLNEKPFRDNFEAVLKSIQNAGVPLLVVRNPRAYTRDMSEEDQYELSAFSRSKDGCFSIEGLHDVYDRHNDIMEEISKGYGIPVLRLDQLVPGGHQYYADSIHFNAEGSNYVANLMLEEINKDHLLAKGGAK
ncbi:MAG: GDSL-type esterase/lipase family protein [Emcibacteraceae bacterium]